MAKRRRNHPTLPPRVLDRIEEAGASAYAWYDQELTSYLDPRGRLSRLSVVLQRVGLVVWIVAISAAAVEHAWWAMPLVFVLLVVGALRGGWETVPWQFTATAVLVFDPMNLPSQVGGGLLAVIGLVTVGTFPRVRNGAFGVLLGCLALTRLGAGDDPLRLWTSVVVAAVAAGVAGWLLAGRTLPLPSGRITRDVLGAVPPPPPSRVPWLVRLLRSRDIAQAPAKITQKRAGAYGERRTGLVLLGLAPRRGVRILHDVDIPGAQTANADHVVLAPTGLFVLDTKQFGTQIDPGRVLLDPGSGEIVHRSDKGDRPLTKTTDTVAWATRAIGGVVGTQARGLLVVHNAPVAPGLTVLMSDGTTVDVISAIDLIARIETGSTVLSRWRLSGMAWALTKLRSATTGGAPRITTPLGAKKSANLRGTWVPAAQPVLRDGPTQTSSPRENTPVSDEGMTQPIQVQSPVTPPTPAGQQVVPQGAPSAVEREASRPATAHRMAPDEALAERWAQMEDSEPASPDDVSPELRGLTRGTPVYVIEFVKSPAAQGDPDAAAVDFNAQDMVAMTAPRLGRHGTYVWVTRPEQWRIHQETRRPVYVATVHTDKIMLRNEGA